MGGKYGRKKKLIEKLKMTFFKEEKIIGRNVVVNLFTFVSM